MKPLLYPHVKLRKIPKLKEYNTELQCTIYNKFFIKTKEDYYAPLTALPLFNNNINVDSLEETITKQYNSYKRWGLHRLIKEVLCLNNTETISIPCEIQKAILGLKYHPILDKLIEGNQSKGYNTVQMVKGILQLMHSVVSGNVHMVNVRGENEKFIIPISSRVHSQLKKSHYIMVKQEMDDALLPMCFYSIGGTVKVTGSNGVYLGQFNIFSKVNPTIKGILTYDEFIGEDKFFKFIMDRMNRIPGLGYDYPIIQTMSYDPTEDKFYFMVPLFDTSNYPENENMVFLLEWLFEEYGGSFIVITVEGSRVEFEYSPQGIVEYFIKIDGMKSFVSPLRVECPLLRENY